MNVNLRGQTCGIIEEFLEENDAEPLALYCQTGDEEGRIQQGFHRPEQRRPDNSD